MAPLVFKTSGTGDPRPVGSIPATSAISKPVRHDKDRHANHDRAMSELWRGALWAATIDRVTTA